MKVVFHQSRTPLLISPLSVKQVVEEVLFSEGCEPDQVDVHFVTKEEISELHEAYFGNPKPTDCITFPIDPKREGEFQLLGEVFICPEVAISVCEEHNTTPLEECTLYLVHTMLHLLGYKDLKEKDIKEMRAKEKEHMERLIKKNLLLKNLPA